MLNLTEVDFKRGPYLDQNTTGTTMTPSGTSGSVTITASSNTFVSTDVGRLIKFSDGHAKITNFSSATQVTATTTDNFSGTGGTTDWSLGTFTSTKGFPRAVSFFEQRLVFAGTTSFPQTIFASESGLYEEFDVGSGNAADAFIYTIAANRVNVIRWLAPARDLIVGTVGGEFKVGRPTGEPLKPDNVQITQQTTYGGYTTQPIQIGNAVLFVQRQQKKVREFAYRFESDAYLAPDMTLLAEHITGKGIVDVDYAQEPDSIYWAVRKDGALLGLTYQREEDVIAWHRHILGGSYGLTFNGASDVTDSVTDSNNNGFVTISNHGLSTGDRVTYSAGGGTKLGGLVDGQDYFVYVKDANNFEFAKTYEQAIDRTIVQIQDGVGANHSVKAQAQVKSVSTISEASENQTYIVVRRRINGSIVQYVEYLDELLKVDSGLAGTVNGSSTSITGLDHLEGETVKVLVNGANHPDKVVSSGSIALDRTATSAAVGLAYTAFISTLDPEVQTETGPSQGKTRRVERITVRVVDTYNLKAGVNQTDLQTIFFRTPSVPMGSLQLFTGDKRLLLEMTPNRAMDIYLQHEDPLPCTILALMYSLVVSER